MFYSFLSIFIIDFMAEIFPFRIIIFLRLLGYYLLVFVTWIPNYRFSKSRVILVIGVFEMISFLFIAIKFMGTTLPWDGEHWLIDAIRGVFLIWFLIIEIKDYPKSEKTISKSQLPGT
ncbi:hypothetical protein RI065_11640 [Mycoplasmatota bacterium zrk1]